MENQSQQPKERAGALLQAGFHKMPELFDEITSAGGVRGLFDQFSAEWNNTEIEDKLDILDKLQLAGFSLDDIGQAAVECIIPHGYSAQQAASIVFSGVCKLLTAALDDRA